MKQITEFFKENTIQFANVKNNGQQAQPFLCQKIGGSRKRRLVFPEVQITFVRKLISNGFLHQW
jgi:hypothetical protein